MESVVVVLVGGLLLAAVVSPLLALVALVRASQLQREHAELSRRLADLERRLAHPRAARAPDPTTSARPANLPATPTVPVPATAPSAPPPDAAPPPTALPSPAPPATSGPSGPPTAASARAPSPPPRSPRPSAARAPGRPAPPGADFATHLGPRLLVAAGGLAVVVFLGLFVRYAWENDWVGPSGRVLSAAVFSLGLVTLGLRLMHRDYRPLGQGLAAAGFAGLYVTAYAAHGFYHLVPRGASAALMIVVLACAVAVADRLDTRLLATLAWTGGYLTPVLLSTGEDRAESLLAWLLLLGGSAVLLTRRREWPEILVLGALGSAVLSFAWATSHLRPERAGIASVGIVLLTALFALGPRPRLLHPAVALLGGGFAAVLLAAAVDRPMLLLGLLAALAATAVVVRSRWAWSESAGVLLAGAAVLAWYGPHFRPERAADALALGLPLAGFYVLAVAVRALGRGTAPRTPQTVTQLASAALSWGILDRVLSLTQPGLLGPAAIALAALHLALGLASRRHGAAFLEWTRVTLGLAVVFLTLAIPVQLGLHGATLGWAAEGLALLWLGLRQDLRPLRLGGYAVLVLAVARLLLRHFPPHAGPFVPVFNPGFATWLAVIAALAAAWAMTRRPAGREEATDHPAGLLLAALSLVLLFGLLSGETSSAFDQRARVAQAAGDAAAALAAQRQGGLGLSLLWTVFATALLSTGLALRSRGLFYLAYGLFAATALKVAMVDLATLPTLYRMLSFLGLGVLLLAGAWLNLRFRERLAPPEEAS